MRNDNKGSPKPKTVRPAKQRGIDSATIESPADGLHPIRKAKRRKRPAVPSVFVPQFWAEQDHRLHVAREVRRRVEALRADAGVDSAQKDLLAQRAVFVALQL